MQASSSAPNWEETFLARGFPRKVSRPGWLLSYCINCKTLTSTWSVKWYSAVLFLNMLPTMGFWPTACCRPEAGIMSTCWLLEVLPHRHHLSCWAVWKKKNMSKVLLMSKKTVMFVTDSDWLQFVHNEMKRLISDLLFNNLFTFQSTNVSGKISVISVLPMELPSCTWKNKIIMKVRCLSQAETLFMDLPLCT